MFRTGETGTVGLRIDLSGKEAVDYASPELETISACAYGGVQMMVT